MTYSRKASAMPTALGKHVAFAIAAAAFWLTGTSTFASTIASARSLQNSPVQLPEPQAKATVLIFILHDCMICNRYAPEINRITSDYKAKQIAVDVVYSDDNYPAAKEQQHASAYGFHCSLLRDPKHTLAKSVGATVTPEAVVLDSAGKVVYRGRIDNSFMAFGMARPKPTTRDLRDVLDKMADGQPVTFTQTAAIGCYIPN